MTSGGGNIMVAMSGGVDSSVAALLLHQEGHSLAGMFMKNWEEDDRFGACPAARDAADAAAVAEALGIAFHTRNFASEYWDRVFEEFIEEHRAGRTPNPDILCNREIKFKTFLEHAEDAGADTIATGHYCRTEPRDGRFRLLRGLDADKDQSYFLYAVGHAQLMRTRFPVGELRKPTVREIACSAGFPVHDKKDSTGICFIGERDFRPFLERYISPCPGEIRTDDGQVISEHRGLMFHTLGQRRGLGIGGVKNRPEAPWYVLYKDQGNNVLYVGQGHEHPWLYSTRLVADSLNWVAGEPPAAATRLTAKIRYRQQDQACTVEQLTDGELRLRFEVPQRAVTPGQSVVLYQGEECLGGGIITHADAPPFTAGDLP